MTTATHMHLYRLMLYTHIPLGKHGLLAHSFMSETQLIQIIRIIYVLIFKNSHTQTFRKRKRAQENLHIVLHKCIQLIDKRYIYDMNTKQS